MGSGINISIDKRAVDEIVEAIRMIFCEDASDAIKLKAFDTLIEGTRIYTTLSNCYFSGFTDAIGTKEKTTKKKAAKKTKK